MYEMPQRPPAIYSNTVNFRMTPTELVLEFGSFFPDQPNQVPPSDFQADVRVVMPINAMQGMLHALSNAVAQRQKAQQQSPPKQPPGFNQPPPKG